MKRIILQSKSVLAVLLAVVSVAVPPLARASVPAHSIGAGNVVVVQNDSGNTTNSVTTFTTFSINSFRVRGNGSADGDEGFAPLNSRGDFPVAVGATPANNGAQGILMSSVAELSRDNGDSGTNIYCVSMIEIQRPNATPTTLAGSYWVPGFVNALGGGGGGSADEHNFNFSAAWFPYTNFVGAFVRNDTAVNGGPLNELIGTPGLAIGTHFFDLGSGRSIVSLTNMGIDARTSGILLVAGAKNESANVALAHANPTNGTWDIYLKDIGAATEATLEQDPVAFVFIPKTNTSIVSGRFLGNASIEMFSGVSPAFTVTSNSLGTYELKVPGRSPTNGVLIISAEGGRVANRDNMVSYQTNASNTGWIIQTRDTPGFQLEAIGATVPVCSFVYIPGRTAGVTVVPSGGLLTSEDGDIATFDITLDAEPKADVTFAVTSSNSGEGIASPSSVTFTTNNWYVPQTITVTGQDDGATPDGAVAYSIQLGVISSADGAYNGLDPADVSAVNIDNDTPGISVSPTSGLVTTEGGGTATFNVRLFSAPSSSVTINLSSSDLTEGTVSPSSLTFDNSNYNTNQTVTVTGVNDLVDDGNIAYTIITAPAISADGTYNGLNAPDVSVSNTDDDTAGVIVSAAGPAGFSVVEGRTNVYTVVLNCEPTANVKINIASSDTSQGGTVSPASLTFTPLNWSNSQPVTVTGADDLVVDPNTSWTINNSVVSADVAYAALSPVPILMTTLDNEPVVLLPDGELIYGIGLAGVGIDGRASLVDPYTANYNGGTLTVSLTTNGTSADRLEIRNTGTDPGQISVSGGTVSYGGTAIATFTGGTGVTPLAVSFNSSATPASGEALLRNVTFRNTNTVPSFSTRAVWVVLVHADGGSGSASKSIRISLVNASDFQEAADHGYGAYTGEVDCHFAQATPNTPFPGGNANGLFIDYPIAGEFNAFHSLMRFDNIFGTNFGQIPTNALIVSAELMLNAYDSGEGSPLYRMIYPFDATNDTWSTFGGGVDLDDIEARSIAESQIQVGDAANTGIGPISTSILPDLLAWQSGAEANNGWVMPGWVGRNDGTGISSRKDPNVSLRPRLRVLWVPAGTAVTKFRQNVNGYTGAADTRIRRTTPDTSSATVTGVFIDWAVTGSTNNDEQVLLKFGDITGTATNQIPPGSQIHGAALELAAVIGAAPGHGGNFYPMLVPWQDTDTWNTLVNGVSADGVEASTTPSATLGFPALTPAFVGGYHSFDMTSDVRAWVGGTKANYGWVGLPWPNGSDGVGFGTAEQATERNRPQLRVYYVPSIVIRSITRDSTTATIVFSGVIGNTYTVLRSGTVNSGYSSIGTATVQPDGSATFTDNSPLPGAAFYRISYP